LRRNLHGIFALLRGLAFKVLQGLPLLSASIQSLHLKLLDFPLLEI
jgi:hypothetical protein